MLSRPVPLLFAGLLLAGAYASATAEQPVARDKALLIVRLPAGAKLTIGGSATEQTGAERTFLSPVLPSDKSFSYKLTATWNKDGKAVTEVREAEVRAGKKTVIDFRTAAPLVKADPPKAKPPVQTPPPAKTEPPVKAEAKTKKEPPAQAAAPKSRTFLFTYGATVTGLTPGEKVRIWLPVPPTNEDQDVKIESKDLPAEGHLGFDKQYGNEMFYLEAEAKEDGTVPLKLIYRVTRREVKTDRSAVPEDAGQLARFLQADAKVPVGGKPLELIKDKPVPMDQMEAARLFYDVVNNHMRYSKEGTGWGQGDAVWACDSRYGNCTDFHSLFISLARSQKIPAKFEIGFPIAEKHGRGDVAGYHCWAKFRPDGKGWVPVDISEANKNPKMHDYYFGNLTEDRIAFSTGRDIELAPKQDGPALNFFIYPYVEEKGKSYPVEKIQRKFSYQDLKGT